MDIIRVMPKMLKGVARLPKYKKSKEGDFRLGAFFLVLGAIGNDVFCEGLHCESDQKNAQIIDIIKSAGGKIEEKSDGISAKMTACMRGIEVDASEIWEIVPAVSVLCAFCKGESKIKGLSSCPDKNMIKGIASEFSHLGIETRLISDGILIKGAQTIRGDGTFVWGNAPLAMALLIGASRAEGEVSVMGLDELSDKDFTIFTKIYEQLKGDN